MSSSSSSPSSCYVQSPVSLVRRAAGWPPHHRGWRVLLSADQTALVPSWTAQGAIYDPLANTWTSVKPPGWWEMSSCAITQRTLWRSGMSVARQLLRLHTVTNRQRIRYSPACIKSWTITIRWADWRDPNGRSNNRPLTHGMGRPVEERASWLSTNQIMRPANRPA